MEKERKEELEQFFKETRPLDKELAKEIKKVRKHYLKTGNYSETAEKFNLSYDKVYSWCNPKRYWSVRGYI